MRSHTQAWFLAQSDPARSQTRSGWRWQRGCRCCKTGADLWPDAAQTGRVHDHGVDHALTPWAHGFAPEVPGDTPQTTGCTKPDIWQAQRHAKTQWQYLRTGHRVCGLVQLLV